jgi:two-component system cell cycle response regulator
LRQSRQICTIAALVALALSVTAVLVLAAGYALGARRARSREKALKITVDEQSEKLALAEHELVRLSSLDPATELPTQQAFQEFLEREWRRAVRDRMSLSLLIIEVDHFRAYNERAGKPQADASLKTVADTFRRLIRRPGDFLARYGVGKFGVVLGSVGQDGAMVLAETLRASIERLKIPNPASATGPLFTVSVGVASVRPERDAAWQDIELIAAGERGLAAATEAGRNRIAFGATPPAAA